MIQSTASKTYTEGTNIYKKKVLNPKDQHQFVLVIRFKQEKSHLIRWFDA